MCTRHGQYGEAKTNPSSAAEVANETSTNVLMGCWAVDERLMYTALSKTKGASETKAATAAPSSKAPQRLQNQGELVSVPSSKPTAA